MNTTPQTTEICSERAAANLPVFRPAECVAQQSNQRRSVRFPYQRRIGIELLNTSAGQSFQAQSIDLGRDGVSVRADRSIGEGAGCRLRLETADGTPHIADGQVAWCRASVRVEGMFDLGVRFSAPIEVEKFCPLAVSVRVLILDNDPLQQKILARVLSQHGAESDFATSAEDAIRKALSEPYDVILVNIDIEELKTCRFIRELRSRGYMRPIVSISSYDLPHVVESNCVRQACDSCRPIELNWETLIQLTDSLRVAPVVSSLPLNNESSQLINKFVFSLQERIAEMERYFSANDMPRSAAMARKLSVFAESCGFEEIAAQAAQFAGVLAAAELAAPLRDQLNGLIRVCLAARPTKIIDSSQAAQNPNSES